MAVDNLIESSLANLFIDTPICYLIISLNASFCENSLLSIVSALASMQVRLGLLVQINCMFCVDRLLLIFTLFVCLFLSNFSLILGEF